MHMSDEKQPNQNQHFAVDGVGFANLSRSSFRNLESRQKNSMVGLLVVLHVQYRVTILTGSRHRAL